MLTRMWKLNAICMVPLVWSSMGIIRSKLHDIFKLLNRCLGLYILVRKAVILHMQYHLKIFTRTMNKKCLVTLRCDIPVVLVKITKFNSRHLKVKTQLYFIYILLYYIIYIYIYIYIYIVVFWLSSVCCLIL